MSEISVVVPVYNVEKYLSRCVDSILAQTFTDFELILIDDGSKDCSGEICDNYAKQHRNIRVIHQDNKGQAAARNLGVEIAKGEWIAFVDSDDLIHPQYLEILYRAVCDTNTKLSVCHAFEDSNIPEDFWVKQRSSIRTYKVNETRLRDWMSESCNDVSKYAYWVVWGKLIHRAILRQYPFTLNRIYEDNAVVYKWLYAAGEITYCDNTMYYYYINTSGTTKSTYNLKRLDWLWAVQEQISFYETVGYSDMEDLLRKRYIWEALREYDHILSLLGDKDAAGKLRRHILLHWVRNRNRINLQYSEKMDIFSRLYPKTVKWLSAIRKGRSR